MGKAKMLPIHIYRIPVSHTLSGGYRPEKKLSNLFPMELGEEESTGVVENVIRTNEKLCNSSGKERKSAKSGRGKIGNCVYEGISLGAGPLQGEVAKRSRSS